MTTTWTRRWRQVRTMALFFLIPAFGAAAPLLVLPAISSRYGASGWGAVAVAQSVGGALAIIGELGWGVVGPQRVAAARRPGERQAIYRSALLTKILTLTVLAPLAALITYHLNDVHRGPTALLAAAVALAALTPTWYFVGEGRPSRVLVSDSLPRVVLNCAAAGLVLLGAPLIGYALLMLLLPVAALLIARRLLGPESLPGRVELGSAPTVIRGQLVLACGRSVSVVYTTLPIALVAAVAPGLVPVFSASERLMRMSLTILAGVPARLQSWIGEAPVELQRMRSRRSILINSGLGVICGLGFGLLAPSVARLVFAGTVQLPYQLSLCSGLLLAIICASRGLGLSLVAARRANLITLAIVAAAATGAGSIVPLTLALGVIGPVLGEIAAEVVGLVTQAVVLRRARWTAPGSDARPARSAVPSEVG